jgi:CzcA family heavy metal efflux pump
MAFRISAGRFALHHSVAIVFVALVLCVAGAFSALNMPSSVFPQTDFPRVVVLVDNGVMPADEMMARITRPIEEVMKDIPGAVSVRSATGRGSAEINVFFDWNTNMQQAELYVNARVAQIRTELPPSAATTVWRLTFTAFPIIGVSLTSPTRDITSLWEAARYTAKPQLLRIPGVARVDIVGGRAPEYHIVADPLRLQAEGLTLADVSSALAHDTIIAPAGMHEEDYTLYLTVVDGRVHDISDIENLTIGDVAGHPVHVRDFARVVRAPEPVYNIVTAEGVNAVLLNIRSQPNGSTLDIARAVRQTLTELRRELPSDVKIAFFYDQSLLVRDSVRSVWEAIGFGLLLSVAILYLFLRNWGTTLIAVTVIPVTVLVTMLAMRLAGMSFNMMTLGGIAAAIGLVIDDAIVVVEAIHARIAQGAGRLEAIENGINEIFTPLLASTLTPVVVFLPLAFLTGLAGSFFRALALTMVVSLLTSLLIALTLTPSLAAWFVRGSKADDGYAHADDEEGPVMTKAIGLYERGVTAALRHRWATIVACVVLLLCGAGLYTQLDSDFLPPLDEGGFVIDYHTPWGTSLVETNRQLLEAERILRANPEIESYSRRTGARLALAIAEPNTGDFLVKLKDNRHHSTDEVITALRAQFLQHIPGVSWDLHGILGDLIGDLTWAPQPIEVKIFSTDAGYLSRTSAKVVSELEKVRGVVDINDGLVTAGPSINFRIRLLDAARFGLTTQDVADALRTAMLGDVSSSVLNDDHLLSIRLVADPAGIDRATTLRELPLRASDGSLITLSQVADVVHEPGQLELRREDLRQDIAVTARLENRDLGSAVREIEQRLGEDLHLPPGTIEFGGLYQQQQESFQNLLIVLAMAVLLVFIVLLVEFRSFLEPAAIVFGAIVALVGSIAALWITGTTLNIVSMLGAIIGVGIVAKNGILMLDSVDRLREDGTALEEALVRSGRRRLRPVLMTSLAAALGMLPLAYGIGSGAAMLQPLAIAIIGSLFISVMLSLIATPTAYYLMISYRAAPQ